MKLEKWNFKTKKYEEFNSPAEKVCLVTDDMDKKIDCANCGKEIKFGEGYSSRTIHTNLGFGYPVCEECYQEEREEELNIKLSKE